MSDAVPIVVLALICAAFVAGYVCATWNHAGAMLRRHNRDRRA